MQRRVALAGWICVAAVIGVILWRIWAAVRLPWWFEPDEGENFSEIIRILRLDPSQRFFQLPATPYMALSAVAAFGYWLVERIAGSTALGPSDFAFAHLQQIFALMRAITMALWASSGLLAYDLFRRSAGAIAGSVAAILLVSNPSYVQYSDQARPESLGMMCCLGAIWLVLYSRWRGSPEIYGAAAVLVGVAAAARYHFAAAGLPFLLVLYFSGANRKLERDYVWLFKAVDTIAASLVAVGMIAAAYRYRWIHAGRLTDVLMLSTRGASGEFLSAARTIAILWIALGIAAGLGLLFRKRLRNVFVLMIAVGFLAGFMAANPECLWRGWWFLRSVAFYSRWVDPRLAAMGFLGAWREIAWFYFRAALPEWWLWLAFACGAVMVLWRKDSVGLAFLAGALAAFFSQPVTMTLWAHHMLPWLAFFCYVAALPLSMISRRFAHPVLLAAIAVALVWAGFAKIRNADGFWKISLSRTDNVQAMEHWMAEQLPAGAFVLVSRHNMNAQNYLDWLEETGGLRIPNAVERTAHPKFWDLDRASLDGRAGYVAVSYSDIYFMREQFELSNPGSTYDPFTDARFEPVASFGDGLFRLKIFRFDLRR